MRLSLKARRAKISEARGVDGFFDVGADRRAFERVWNPANYDALTELLAETPVHWRFFVKHRIFEAIEAISEAEVKVDGADVRACYHRVVEEFPQLRAAMEG